MSSTLPWLRARRFGSPRTFAHRLRISRAGIVIDLFAPRAAADDGDATSRDGPCAACEAAGA
jgi:hypothetical protein